MLGRTYVEMTLEFEGTQLSNGFLQRLVPTLSSTFWYPAPRFMAAGKGDIPMPLTSCLGLHHDVSLLNSEVERDNKMSRRLTGSLASVPKGLSHVYLAV